MLMKYEWIKTIPNFEDHFDKEHKLIIDKIGVDNYLKLYECFGKTAIYFSSGPINALKKTWAQLHPQVDPNEAARILDVSTKTVYNFRQRDGGETMEIPFAEDE